MVGKRGFTLVELSIVLVILGLLVGGVLTGQSLIRAAQLRSTLTESTRYLTAVNAFRDKYFAVPGDMTNATSFWGSLGGTGSDATCQNIAATAQATCNGNGDGLIATSVVNDDENMRFWQHLANAGLVEGQYRGTEAGAFIAGTNLPGSKVDGKAVWFPAYFGNVSGSTSMFAMPMQNMFLLMTGYVIPILAPEEAWNIDTKIDDAMPGTGKIIVFKGTTGNCTTATGVAPPGDANAKYQLTYPSKECIALYYRF